ncbi:hypothetical protein [Metallococcus carri]|uniref:hypothetical protein n=1 Tax=Metallococcus carri TaxID=1656884 RepID=UPI0015833CE8|nr:hypothetical protein [Metallococcus carri]
MTDPTSLPNFSPQGGGQPSGPNSNGAPGATPVRDQVVAVLQQDGFRPEIDVDDDVSYRVEGNQLFARVVESQEAGQPAVIRIFGQWQISDELPQDVQVHLLAANDVTLSLNIIKCGIANGNLVVMGEHLINDGSDLPMLVQSTTGMVLHAVGLWHQSVTSGGPHAATADPAEAGDILPQTQPGAEGPEGRA